MSYTIKELKKDAIYYYFLQSPHVCNNEQLKHFLSLVIEDAQNRFPNKQCNYFVESNMDMFAVILVLDLNEIRDMAPLVN